MGELPRFVPKDRIVAFSDGVFAVVITILVFGIEVPGDTMPTGAALMEERTTLGHQLLIYCVAFWFIALYWSQHTLLFGSVKHVDRRLMLLNLLFLFPVTLLPFVTQLMGAQRADWRVVAAFALANLFTALVFGRMWKRVASQKHMHLSAATALLAQRVRKRIPYLAIVMTAGVLLAVIDVRVGTLLMLLVPLVHFYTHARESPMEARPDSPSDDAAD